MTYRGLEVRGDDIFYNGWRVAVFVPGAPPSVQAAAREEMDIGDFVEAVAEQRGEDAFAEGYAEGQRQK